MGYTPNTKQYLFYRLVARQIQGLTTGVLGATEKLSIATLRFTYNQNVAFIDSVLCIGDPVGGTTPAANCILDINGATNMQGSVNILGNVGVGVTDTTTYKLNVGGTTYVSGLLTANGGITTNNISSFGSNGPLVIDPNFSTNNYIQMYDDVRVGGVFSCTGTITASNYVYGANYVYSSGFLQGAGGGGAFRFIRPDNWCRLQDGGGTHIDFAANQLYAHSTLTAQAINCGGINASGLYASGTISTDNEVYCNFYSQSNSGNDYCCVPINSTWGQFTGRQPLRVAYGTFTGFHRVYSNDILFDEESPDIFKNNYMGRVVISIGKIKTDFSEDDEEKKVVWSTKTDKDGITIEDALPIIQLSRIKKDKRVFGVMGDPKRNNNNKCRLIVNSVGEGGICVVNTNGNIENGDYIQSSDLLGYGEKQDDDLLHNYTIAKATIDCNFELDSPYYQCHEIENGVRVAFIACSYHCG